LAQQAAPASVRALAPFDAEGSVERSRRLNRHLIQHVLVPGHGESRGRMTEQCRSDGRMDTFSQERCGDAMADVVQPHLGRETGLFHYGLETMGEVPGVDRPTIASICRFTAGCDRL
jgi:hypothetical protein